MEIRGKMIGGLKAVQVRDALRAFLDVDTSILFDNGEFKYQKKILKADFLAKELNLTDAGGAALLAELINDGYVDKNKLTPTSLGMALSQAEDRDRLPLSEASKLLDEFLEAVKTANAKHGARILIQRVHVFGSYLAGAETVGDIDLLVEAPLPEDCEPEDIYEFEAVMEAIKISEYLSFHDEFDLITAEAKKCLIYDLKNPT